MTEDVDQGIRVRVLGTPGVLSHDVLWISLPPRGADVLVALALAGPAGRSGRWLRQNLWSNLPGGHLGVVATTIGDLRGRGVDIPKPGDGAPYVLECDPAAVDSWRFVTGVRDLGADPAPREIDELLGLWTANPRD